MVQAKEKLDCAVLPQGICDAADEGTLEKSGMWKMIVLVINIMTVGIGLIAVAAIVYAGFLYTTAQGSSEQTKKAKEMILNTVIGLVLFGLMWAFLQYLIPGGVFR